MTTATMHYLIDSPAQRIDLTAKALLVVAIFFMPISTAATNVFMALTLIAWLLAGGFGARLASLKGNDFAYATLGLFLLLCLGATYSSGSREDILYDLHKNAKLLFMLPAITLMQEDSWRKRGLMAFGTAMLLTLALSLASVIGPLPFFRGTQAGGHYVFRDYIAQNLMMSFFALLMLVQGKFEAVAWKRLAFWILALLSVIDILFFVQGRTGYVSLAFNLLVFVAFLGSLRQKVIAVLLIFVLGLAAFQFSPHFKSRLDSAVSEYKEQDEKKLTSVGQRVEFFKKGVQLISERPLFGFGTGAYHKEFCRVADTKEWCSAGQLHPHNQFISFGVQLGLAGLLAYLLYLFVCVKQAWAQSPATRLLGIGMVTTLMADSAFHAPLFLVAEASFFILLLPIFMAIGTGTSHAAPRQAAA